MSKPTFLQSVLGRPSRSYAETTYDPPSPPLVDPHNPYKGYAHDSLPRSRSEVAFATNRSYQNDAGQPGPSRRRAPAASATAGGGFAAHQFPSHSSALGYAPRHGYDVALDDHSESGSTLGYARSDLGIGLPPGASPFAPARSRSGRRIVSDGAAETSHYHGHFPGHFRNAQPPPDEPPPRQQFTRQVQVTAAPRHHYEVEYDYEYEPSPPPSNVSSTRNDQVPPPRRPAMQNFSRYDAYEPQPPTPARTPQSSVPSSLASSSENSTRASTSEVASRYYAPRPRDLGVETAKPAKAAHAAAPVIITQTGEDVSDSEDEVFYTPRSSLDLSRDGNGPEDLTTPVSEVTVLPVFQLQPPTPLNDDPTTPPLERSLREISMRSLLTPTRAQGQSSRITEDDETETDTETEHVAPTSSIPVASAVHDKNHEPRRPQAGVTPPLGTTTKSKTPRKKTKARSASIASTSSEGVPPPLPPKPTSRGGRVRGAQVIVLNASNTAPSSSVIPTASPPLRRSKSAKSLKTKATISTSGLPSSPSFPSEFRTTSEVGTSRTSSAVIDRRQSSGSMLSVASHARSLDGGIRTAGYGKGGWAAASAAPVVMYMPTNGSDGWAAFQPLPPRSRASILPGSQVPQYPRHASYGSGSTGSSSLAPSASASQDGRHSSYASPRHSPGHSPRHSPGHSPRYSPTGSPTSGVFPSHPFQSRKYEPSSLSRSSSPFTSPPMPARQMQSRNISPAITPSPAESDDETDGEMPSRSYALSRPAVKANEYGSDVAMSSGTASDPSSRTPSVVRFEGLDEPGVRDQRRPSPPIHDTYDRRMSPPSRSQSMVQHRIPSPPRPYAASASSTYAPSSAYQRGSLSSAMTSTYGSDVYSNPQTPRGPRSSYGPSTSGMSESGSSRRVNLGPSTIDPDLLTFLPEMDAAASDALYKPSDNGHKRHGSDGIRRSMSLKSIGRSAKSDIGVEPYRRSHLTPNTISRSQTGRISLDGPESGTIAPSDVLMESHGRDLRGNGYTNLILPRGGGYKPVADPVKELTRRDARIASLPHTSMAAITLSSSLLTNKKLNESATPWHLRHNLPPLVDFTSHIAPPTKVGSNQIMVQVYAVAVDSADIAALEDRTVADVGKYIPGRSFAGRVMVVGDDEKDLQRGDLVMGLVDIRKSGALCEYIVVDRRRVARAPANDLSLEQLALLPSQGITALRALRGILARGAQAVVMDAHEGVAALMCQEMSRRGVTVTAVIPDVDQATQDAIKAKAYEHGAAGGIVGTPAAALMSLNDAIVHLVVDTRGGPKIQQAAKRALVDGGHLLTLASGGKPASPTSFRDKFRRRIGDNVAYAGIGETNVDASGLDCRDVMEEPAMEYLVPVVGRVVPFERGAELFVAARDAGALSGGVVRIIN